MKRAYFKPGVLAAALAIAALAGCIGKSRSSSVQLPKTADGFVPVYDSTGTALDVVAADPEPVTANGQVYVQNDTLYQVDPGRGIHVISIANPEMPKKLKFLRLLGCQEVIFRDGVVYTNSLNDLVVLDISNLSQPRVLRRIANSFHFFDANRPPENGYFECVDTTKGRVIGWRRATLSYPRCIAN